MQDSENKRKGNRDEAMRQQGSRRRYEQMHGAEQKEATNLISSKRCNSFFTSFSVCETAARRRRDNLCNTKKARNEKKEKGLKEKPTEREKEAERKTSMLNKSKKMNRAR